MKILIVSPFAREASRGNSIAADRLARGFGSRGHEVVVLKAPAVSAQQVVPGSRLSADPSTRIDSASFIPDVALALHAFHCHEAIMGLNDAGIPVVLSLRGTDHNEMLTDPATSAIVRESISMSNRIAVFCVIAKEAVMRLANVPEDKVSVIANGLEVPRSGLNFRKTFSIPGEAFVFVSLAGVREVKGIMTIAYGLAELRKRLQKTGARDNGPAAKDGTILRSVGSGGSPLGTSPDIFFLHAGPVIEDEVDREFEFFRASNPWVVRAGEIDHSVIDSFLRSGDVFISASRSEGMPHAMREAMHEDVPCLVSDIHGHRHMALDDQALFFNLAPGVDGHDFGDLVDKAALLIANPGFRRCMGLAGAERVKDEMARSNEIDDYLACLEETGAGK